MQSAPWHAAHVIAQQARAGQCSQGPACLQTTALHAAKTPAHCLCRGPAGLEAVVRAGSHLGRGMMLASMLHMQVRCRPDPQARRTQREKVPWSSVLLP